jgi:flavin reductase (DIM6/NTAB) family NADH-FMN oxidoreductase RutF
MIINLLSASQSSAALRFSRADVYPRPFEETVYTLSEDGLPILSGSLGALSCRLIRPPLALSDLRAIRGLGSLADERRAEVVDEGKVMSGGVVSELIIAQVIRVETVQPLADEANEGERNFPLLYHRQQYTTIAHPNTLDNERPKS